MSLGLAIVIVASSSTTKNQGKGMRPHIVARKAQGPCVH